MIPKRITRNGKTTNTFYIRRVPGIKPPYNDLIIGELFVANSRCWFSKEEPFFMVYKELFPIYKDGFMTWHFKDLDEVKSVSWKPLDPS
jgi:hypothetical protein